MIEQEKSIIEEKIWTNDRNEMRKRWNFMDGRKDAKGNEGGETKKWMGCGAWEEEFLGGGGQSHC